jgi:hypothetical protein
MAENAAEPPFTTDRWAFAGPLIIVGAISHSQLP